mgnify:CR=1 FL=1
MKRNRKTLFRYDTKKYHPPDVSKSIRQAHAIDAICMLVSFLAVSLLIVLGFARERPLPLAFSVLAVMLFGIMIYKLRKVINNINDT